MINSPCKDCTLRNETCHSTCKMYKQFKADLEIEKAKKKVFSDRYADYKVSLNRSLALHDKSEKRKIKKI